MAASFSTLKPTDRVLVSAPKNCFEFSSLVHCFGEVVDCTARNFHGKKVLNAVKIGNDCFDVTIENFNHCFGKLVKGKVIRFTTSETWVNEWIETARIKTAV
jgi:hypothetical protein